MSTTSIVIEAHRRGVVADGTSIAGNGTAADPLHTIVGGTAVAHDATLTGNGTTASPLHVVPGAANPVVADGVSITGNGTLTAPLKTIAGGTSVAHDVTLTGNGTNASPLHVVPPPVGSVGVLTDATLTGNGTTGNPLHVVASAPAPVTTDGTSIAGAGTAANPLRTLAGGTPIAHDATLIGNGTNASPLQVAPPAAGSIAVITDATLTGNGTTGSPLHVVPGAPTPVVADGSSIAGNGTPAAPLHTVTGGTPIVTDATLTGNGTVGSPLHAAPPAAGTVGVATDNTLTGDGTTTNPLHVAALPVALAGVHFQPVNGPALLTLDTGTISVAAGATTTGVIGALNLPAGTQLSSISVTVVDSPGATLVSTWGMGTTVLGISSRSTGSGLPQTLALPGLPRTVKAGDPAYWMTVVAGGSGGWSLIQADLS